MGSQYYPLVCITPIPDFDFNHVNVQELIESTKMSSTFSTEYRNNGTDREEVVDAIMSEYEHICLQSDFSEKPTCRSCIGRNKTHHQYMRNARITGSVSDCCCHSQPVAIIQKCGICSEIECEIKFIQEELIRQYTCYGIEVSSGLETDPRTERRLAEMTFRGRMLKEFIIHQKIIMARRVEHPEESDDIFRYVSSVPSSVDNLSEHSYSDQEDQDTETFVEKIGIVNEPMVPVFSPEREPLFSPEREPLFRPLNESSHTYDYDIDILTQNTSKLSLIHPDDIPESIHDLSLNMSFGEETFDEQFTNVNYIKFPDRPDNPIAKLDNSTNVFRPIVDYGYENDDPMDISYTP